MQPNACAIRNVKQDMTNIQPSDPPQRRNDLPPEVLAIIKPALQVGGLSGLSGLTAGAFVGLFRSKTPVAYAIASGIQWATFGTTFYASRGLVLHAWGKENITPRQKTYASAIAGSLGGSVTGLMLRGPKSIIPGALVFSIFGATGQALYNAADARQTMRSEMVIDPEDHWMKSKWSPFTVLSDEEYKIKLEEQKLSINAEIAIVDEYIETWRAQEKKELQERSQQKTSDEQKDAKAKKEEKKVATWNT